MHGFKVLLDKLLLHDNMCINMTNNKNRNNNTFCLQLFKYLTVFSLSSVFQLFTFIFHIRSFVWQFTLISRQNACSMWAGQADRQSKGGVCMHAWMCWASRHGQANLARAHVLWPVIISICPFALPLSISLFFFSIYVCTYVLGCYSLLCVFFLLDMLERRKRLDRFPTPTSPQNTTLSGVNVQMWFNSQSSSSSPHTKRALHCSDALIIYFKLY